MLRAGYVRRTKLTGCKDALHASAGKGVLHPNQHRTENEGLDAVSDSSLFNAEFRRIA
jgi:hypothetical protein